VKDVRFTELYNMIVSKNSSASWGVLACQGVVCLMYGLFLVPLQQARQEGRIGEGNFTGAYLSPFLVSTPMITLAAFHLLAYTCFRVAMVSFLSFSANWQNKSGP